MSKSNVGLGPTDIPKRKKVEPEAVEHKQSHSDTMGLDPRIIFLNRLISFEHLQIVACMTGHIQVRPKPLDGSLICPYCSTVQMAFDPDRFDAFKLSLPDLFAAMQITSIKYKIDYFDYSRKVIISTRIFNLTETTYRGIYDNNPYDELDLVLSLTDAASESIYLYITGKKSTGKFVEVKEAEPEVLLPPNYISTRRIADALGVTPRVVGLWLSRSRVDSKVIKGKKYVNIKEFITWYEANKGETPNIADLVDQ